MVHHDNFASYTVSCRGSQFVQFVLYLVPRSGYLQARCNAVDGQVNGPAHLRVLVAARTQSSKKIDLQMVERLR